MAVRVVLILAIVACIVYVHSKSVQNLSCEQIQDFVNGHNSRRLLLAKGQVSGQPAAAEMKYMIWDDELAEKAAKWAAQSKDHHNPDKSVGSGRFTTGESLYWHSTTDRAYKLTVDMVMESWFNEHKYYKYGPRRKSNSTGRYTGHYTQMAWSDTTHVGCAVLQFQTAQRNNHSVVCNYGPTGNYKDELPYKSGKPSGQLVCGNYDCDHPYGDRC